MNSEPEKDFQLDEVVQAEVLEARDEMIQEQMRKEVHAEKLEAAEEARVEAEEKFNNEVEVIDGVSELADEELQKLVEADLKRMNRGSNVEGRVTKRMSKSVNRKKMQKRSRKANR